MYKIGDKVIYQGADKKAYKRVGVLKSIEEKDGKPQLTVEFDDGETFTAPVDDWSREFTNSRACNSFWQGNRVRYIGDDPRWKGMTGVILRVNDNSDDNRENMYCVDFPERPLLPESELEAINSNACTSTNSVVRNAMAANRRVARNGRRDNPATMRAYNLANQALTALEKARYVIGGAEDDDYAPIEAKAIDSAIGQVKAAIRSME